MTDLPDPTHKPTHACDLVKEGPDLTCPAGLPVPRGTVLTRRTLRSVATLVLLGLLVTGANLLWTAHAVRSFQSSQQQQGQILGRRLCQTFGALAALKPPAGSAAANPSRAYEQSLHATLDQLGVDLGCGG